MLFVLIDSYVYDTKV